MTDEEFVALEPPQALVAVYAVADVEERARMRLLYARTRGMLVDGSGASRAPAYRGIMARTDDGPRATAPIEARRVVGRISAALTQRGVAFVVAALLIVAAPRALMQWGVNVVPATLDGSTLLQTWLIVIVTLVAGGMLNGLLTGWIAAAMSADALGAPTSVAEANARAARASAGLLGGGGWAAVSVSLASVLLVVPGLMVACAWAVWAPAMVVERKGFWDAFERSADLTRGNRWVVFGLGLLASVVYAALLLILSAMSAASGILGAGGPEVFNLAVMPVLEALRAMVVGCGVAALHAELVTARDGVAEAQVAEIFG